MDRKINVNTRNTKTERHTETERDVVSPKTFVDYSLKGILESYDILTNMIYGLYLDTDLRN